MSEVVYKHFSQQLYRLPADRELQAQIHSIRKITTAAKHSRFDCDANEKHHADKYWAFALAEHAVDTGQSKRGKFFTQIREKYGIKDGSGDPEKKSRPMSQDEVLERMRRKLNGG